MDGSRVIRVVIALVALSGSAWLVGKCGELLPTQMSVATLFAHEENPSEYNYYEHVRPILAEHCGGCHRAGGVGPMSLLAYEDTLPWANAIKLQLLEETMPPWLPDATSERLHHARSLSPEELNIVVDWAVGQTPEGIPSPSEFSDPHADGVAMIAESAATDDTVTLQPEEPVMLGEDDYELDACLVLPVGLDRARTLVAAKFLPGDGRPILRRVVAVRGEQCDPESRPIFTWLPDRPAASLDSRAGLSAGERLDANSSIAVSILYRKGWREEGETIRDLPRLALRFSADESEAVMSATKVTEPVFTVDSELRLTAIYPMPGEPSKPNEPNEPNENDGRFSVSVELPDGNEKLLLNIERYQEDWREQYVLQSPLTLPAGAKITMNQPSAWLYFVSASTDSAEAP